MILADRVREYCISPGLGDVTLLGAVTAYRTFASVMADGETCYIAIVDFAGPLWEISLATYRASTNRLERTAAEVLASSSGAGTLVNFASGAQDVWIDAPAALLLAASGDKNYVHTQSTPSATWTVNHGLGKNPAVEVLTSAGDRVISGVNHVNTNTTVLTFASALSGRATFN